MEQINHGILVANAGSSSIKYHLFAPSGTTLLRAQYDRTSSGDTCTIEYGGRTNTTPSPKGVFSNTASDMSGLIARHYPGLSLASIGFRIVHGGFHLKETSWLTEEVMAMIDAASSLAPLHNPPCLDLIHAWQKHLPHLPMFGVFDTAFHATIPHFASTYALPSALEEETHIRKYGFHGIAYASVVRQLEELLGYLPERLIACHLGSGSSICAMYQGKSVDTSMGTTPLEGLIMATRTGDMDPGSILLLEEYLRTTYPEETEEETEAKLRHILSKESGLLGMAGTPDMREILAMEATSDRAALAVAAYTYRVRKYIGAYAAALGGIDGLIFSGGIGEGSDYLREKILSPLTFLGLAVDPEKNQNAEKRQSIGRASSHPIWVMGAEEDKEIFLEGLKLTGTQR
ncbi:acetate kinase [Candidatus Gracilibacteria bacterium CG17_big_fil_post_rev_8_21_14_2_50_48_13]|nr:MAG: acetate kinase [Candidatus Gracilibacteria bacterium CG17_big_fil_post_rev_8_21_14_2_50_48_13]